MLSTFGMVNLLGSSGWDNERLIRCLHPVDEVFGPPTTRPFDPVGGPPLVDAEPAVHPLETTVGRVEQGRDPVLRSGVELLVDRRPLHRVRMWRLVSHRQVDRALVGED